MQIHFVTFATPAFRVRQALLNTSARWFGQADQIHAWTKARLARDGFTARHPELFAGSTGYGWYAWKPHIILQAMQAAADGDLVVYQDVGRREPVWVSRPLRAWDAYLAERNLPCIAGVRIPAFGANRLWTKRAVFAALELRGPRYEDAPQVQASWSVWRKQPRTLEFITEWAACCRDLKLVGGHLEQGIAGEVPGFREHRWDQSLLTLLALREGLPVLDAGERRAPELNEKAIDSFTPGQPAALCGCLFRGLCGAYHHSEAFIKYLARGLGKG